MVNTSPRSHAPPLDNFDDARLHVKKQFQRMDCCSHIVVATGATPLIVEHDFLDAAASPRIVTCALSTSSNDNQCSTIIKLSEHVTFSVSDGSVRSTNDCRACDILKLLFLAMAQL